MNQPKQVAMEALEAWMLTGFRRGSKQILPAEALTRRLCLPGVSLLDGRPVGQEGTCQEVMF